MKWGQNRIHPKFLDQNLAKNPDPTGSIFPALGRILRQHWLRPYCKATVKIFKTN
jgi:hypothetical protein